MRLVKTDSSQRARRRDGRRAWHTDRMGSPLEVAGYTALVGHRYSVSETAEMGERRPGTHHHLLPLPELRLASACASVPATASRQRAARAAGTRLISRLHRSARSPPALLRRCQSAATAAAVPRRAATCGRCCVPELVARAPVQKRQQRTGGGGGGDGALGAGARAGRPPTNQRLRSSARGGACSRPAAPDTVIDIPV